MHRFTRNAFPAALALGFLLSPESLVKLGNGVGRAGGGMIALILLATLIYSVNGSGYDRMQRFQPALRVESEALSGLFGKRLGTALPFITRFPALVCFGTAVLATAGYLFNEIFVYWFPNFAFAFLVLGFLTLLNLFAPRGAQIVQLLCVSIAIAGLICLAGAAAEHWNGIQTEATRLADGLDLSLATQSLSLFIGFELSLYAPDGSPDPHLTRPPSRVLVLLAGFLFAVWSAASLGVVPMEKLSVSTVPHFVVARGMLGETGRSIMGLVALAGCCAVVNGSLLVVTSLGSARTDTASTGNTPSRGKAWGRVLVVCYAAAVACFLAMGIAGEPELDIWIRGSILLWYSEYGAFNLCLALVRPRSASGVRYRASAPAWDDWARSLLAPMFLLLVVISVWHDPERTSLLTFFSVAPVLSGIILLPWDRAAAGLKLKH